MKNVLITGGAGFIGSSLLDKLLSTGDFFVVVADNLLTGKLANLPKPSPSWKFFKCDVNNYQDISAIMLSHKFDYVFHYAAVVGVQRTLANPVSVLMDIEGTKNILNLCKNSFVKRVFYSSD